MVFFTLSDFVRSKKNNRLTMMERGCEKERTSLEKPIVNQGGFNSHCKSKGYGVDSLLPRKIDTEARPVSLCGALYCIPYKAEQAEVQGMAVKDSSRTVVSLEESFTLFIPELYKGYDISFWC